MYKPRLVSFTVRGEKVLCDTRMGRYGVYPGDLCKPNKRDHDLEGWLFLGVTLDGDIICAYEYGKETVIRYDSIGFFENSWSTLIICERFGKRLYKDMVQFK
jgi:hypothetical protein